MYPYARHPDTDIWLMAWAFNDEKPVLWHPKRAPYAEMERSRECGWCELPYNMCCCLPQRVTDHIKAGGDMLAHNAQFERIMWQEIMVKRYGAPPVKMEQWFCSAAEAAAMCLPRHLAGLTAVLKMGVEKDLEGHRLMMQMCKPRKINDDGSIIWWDAPEKIARLGAYCIKDVESEQGATKCLRRLSAHERQVYLLDQTINDRGIKIDRELIVALREVADEGIEKANLAIDELTSGFVNTVTKNAKLKQWLNDNGVETDSVGKPAVVKIMETDLAPEIREVLQIRSDAARSSLAKLDSMLLCACIEDDRVRGTLFFHGAGTGRWTAKLIQPQNFTRGSVDNIESYIRYVLAKSYATLGLFYHPLEICASMLRSTLVAEEGHDLIAADYSGIEAKSLNYLAGQNDIVELFAKKIDVYKHNAAKMFKIPYASVTKDQRQTGKFQELGCGFGMGPKKAREAADTPMYGNLKLTHEESVELVANYRDTHDHVVDYWHAAENAVMNAVRAPGVAQLFGPHGRQIKTFVAGAYLYIQLPSKRLLMFASPRIEEVEKPWSTKEKPAFGPAVCFSGVNPKTSQWERSNLYGGLIVQNIVQGFARDLLADAMLRLEAHAYRVVMTVHDEIVVEVPKGWGSVKEMEGIMCELPEWALGCPVTAEGWRGERYKK